MPTSLLDPRLWSILSTVALLVAVAGFVLGGDFAWLALAVSGVLFLVEQVLKRRSPAAG